MRAAHHPVVLVALWVASFALACTSREAEPGDSCRSIQDCIADQELACSQDECRRLPCARSSACPVGAACLAGVCGPPQCERDDDCVARQRCYEGDCRSDLCAFKVECDPGLVCIGEPPLCKLPPGRCANDRECPADTFCKLPEATCERKCTSDASCGAEAYCDDEFCRLRCRTSADCAAADACVDGRCEPVDCPTTSCPDSAPLRDPTTCACVSCLDDSDCSADARLGCSTEGRCIFCLLHATTASECTSQGLTLLEGCCTECVADRDCPDGSTCSDGRCVLRDPRECVFDPDCPPGARCDLGFCVQPGSRTTCARQSDCPAGEACYGDGRCRAESQVCEQCAAPSRCVAEPGDTTGSCVGCAVACDAAGCGMDLCVVPPGAAEGFCADPVFAGCG